MGSALMGSALMGSSLMGSLQIPRFSTEGLFWVLPLIMNLLLSSRGGAEARHGHRRRGGPGAALFGRGNDMVGNPHRAPVSQFGVFRADLLIELRQLVDYQSSNSRQQYSVNGTLPPSYLSAGCAAGTCGGEGESFGLTRTEQT